MVEFIPALTRSVIFFVTFLLLSRMALRFTLQNPEPTLEQMNDRISNPISQHFCYYDRYNFTRICRFHDICMKSGRWYYMVPEQNESGLSHFFGIDEASESTSFKGLPENEAILSLRYPLLPRNTSQVIHWLEFSKIYSWNVHNVTYIQNPTLGVARWNAYYVGHFIIDLLVPAFALSLLNEGTEFFNHVIVLNDLCEWWNQVTSVFETKNCETFTKYFFRPFIKVIEAPRVDDFVCFRDILFGQKYTYTFSPSSIQLYHQFRNYVFQKMDVYCPDTKNLKMDAYDVLFFLKEGKRTISNGLEIDHKLKKLVEQEGMSYYSGNFGSLSMTQQLCLFSKSRILIAPGGTASFWDIFLDQSYGALISFPICTGCEKKFYHGQEKFYGPIQCHEPDYSNGIDIIPKKYFYEYGVDLFSLTDFEYSDVHSPACDIKVKWPRLMKMVRTAIRQVKRIERRYQERLL